MIPRSDSSLRSLLALPVAHDVDPVVALASCIYHDRPLLAWAVRFASLGDPLPDAWSRCPDVTALSVIAAVVAPDRFADAVRSLPSARYPAPAGDALQLLAMFPEARTSGVLAAIVRDARRMLRAMAPPSRTLVDGVLRAALLDRVPTVALADVIGCVETHDSPHVVR